MKEYDYSGQLALINLVIWFVMLFKCRRAYTLPFIHNTKGSGYLMVTIFTIIYGVFAFAEADTYHLEDGYEYMYKSGILIQVEPFYLSLIQALPYNYYLFRLVVWGIAAILLFYSAYRIKLDSKDVGFAMAITLLPYFSQTRGSLGFTLLLLSMTLVIAINQKISVRLLGVVGIFLSISFHKSIPIYILLIPVAYLLPLKQKYINASLILFPILYTSMSMLSTSVLQLTFLDEITVEKGNSYLDREATEFNTTGMFFNIFQWISIVLLMFIMTKYYINNKDNCNKTILFIHKYAYVVFYVAFLCFGQAFSSFLYSRTLHFGYFPLLFSFAYYLQNTYRNKLDKIVILLLTLSSFKEIAYHIYKWW